MTDLLIINQLRQYIKKEYRKENNILYISKNSRKDENYRKGKEKFCYSQILLEVDSNNNINNQKFKLLKEHSTECYNINKHINEEKIILILWVIKYIIVWII